MQFGCRVGDIVNVTMNLFRFDAPENDENPDRLWYPLQRAKGKRFYIDEHDLLVLMWGPWRIAYGSVLNAFGQQFADAIRGASINHPYHLRFCKKNERIF